MHSIEFRKIALKLFKRDGILKTCNFLNIHRTTLWRWRRNICIKKRKPYIKTLFTRYKNQIKNILLNNPCTTINKIKYELKALSKLTISKYIKLIGFTKKRTQKRGISNNKNLKELTDLFISKYKQFQKENIVCVDECGFSEYLRPQYGYSKIGEPLVLKTSGKWSNFSLLMAIFPNGGFEYSIVEGSINKEIFEEFINNLYLEDNQAVLMDNASIHKRLSLKQFTNIIYTPPYSPEYNAIELCFSQIKKIYREKLLMHKSDISSAILDSIETGLNEEKICNCYNHVDVFIVDVFIVKNYLKQ
jgi:transposase